MGQEKQWAEFEPVYYDELTGLLNKRFILNIESILDGKISLGFFDIDNFKHINDVYGHFAGDKIIQETSELIKNHCRKGDYPLRFGGDEFIIISKSKNVSELCEATETLRKYIESRPFIVSNKSILVTLSFGIAEGEVTENDSVLQNADFALYCSKEKGKNCSTIYASRESGGVRMDLREEREIKKSLAGEKSVIIKGGFKSGKSTLLRRLKAEFPKAKYFDFDNPAESEVTGQSVVVYNPATVEDNKKLNKLLYSIKQTEHDEYTLSNFSRDDIVRFLELAGKKPTLFIINYLEMTTNGNPHLVSRYALRDKREKFETISDLPAKEELSSLSESAVKALKRVNKMGLEISLSEAAGNAALYRDIEFLHSLGILIEKDLSLTYSYPPLYFSLSDEKHADQSHRKMLELARKKRICESSSDRNIALSTALDMYNFGDMEEAQEILDRSLCEGDDALSLRARILIAESNFEAAEREIEKIGDSTVKTQTKILKTVSTAGELDMERLDDPYTNILYTSYCIRKQSFELVEDFVRSIDQTVLTQKEYVSHLSNLANYYMYRQRENEAVDCFLKCEEICRKELFLADLGKVYMMMGNMFDQRDELFKALEYFNKAMEIFPYTSMNSIVWSINLNLAVTYLKLGEFTKSLDMFTSLLSMEREKDNEFYMMVVHNNLADAYIRMYEWENAEFYNNLVLDFYKDKSSTPDFAVLQSRKIKAADNSFKWLKLDYFNKDDIISILDSMTLDFIKNERSPDINDLKKFVAGLLGVEKNEEMLYKAELMAYMAYIYRDEEEARKYLQKSASNVFLSMKLILRDNVFRQMLDQKVKGEDNKEKRRK